MSEMLAPHFHDLHKDVKESSNTEYIIRGGRGSTKSSFVAFQIVLGIAKDKEANAIVLRRFENEIRDSVFAQLQWAINKLGMDDLWRAYTSPFKLVYLPTGQVILFKGADNPKKLKSLALVRGYLKYAWFEEVDQFSGMEEIRNLEQSIFRGVDPTKKQIEFFTYNPPKSARSWINEEAKKEKPGRVVHNSDYLSVPPEWLGEKFVLNAEHLKQTNPDAYEHEYLGRETGTGLEVFQNVVLKPISNKEINLFDNRHQGLDFGYAADPMCFIQGNFDAKKKRLYLFYEYSGNKITNAQLASRLTDDRLADVTMADASEPKSIDELRDEHGMNVMAADKYPGSVDHGIKYLQDMEQIIIDPKRCPLAAKEFINYALDVNRQGEVISKYPDRNNHCFAGHTQVSIPGGSKRIDQIKPGDTVLTRQGPRRVNKVFVNELPVVTTKLLNGQSLTLTDTHDIITKHGKVMFKDLTHRDIVYYEVPGCGFIETENRKWQYLRAKNIAAIQRAGDGLIEYISRSRVLVAGTNTSTLQFMRASAEMCQRVATFTIKMAIRSITLRVIWSASQVERIYLSMRSSIIRAIKMLSERISTVFGPLRRFGMRVTKAMRGILGMPQRYFRIVLPLSEPASSAAHASLPSIWAGCVFAQTDAKLDGEENRGSTTKSEHAPHVGRSLLSIGTPSGNTAPVSVFDLEIDEVHEYFANGILVANSIDAVRYMMSQAIKADKIERRGGRGRARPIPTRNKWRKR
jgi:phage terminase large subunit